MVILRYAGELFVGGILGVRWMYRVAAMLPFICMAYVLLVGLADATQVDTDPKVKGLNQRAQIFLIIG